MDGKHPVKDWRDPPLRVIDKVSDDKLPPKEANGEASGAQGGLQGERQEESVE